MFGELPKVFDRNFAINYFLPATAFITLSYFILKYFGLAESFTNNIAQDLVKGTVILSLLSYFGGVLLLVLNGDLYSLLSGYGKFNPYKLFQSLEIRRYRKIMERIEILNAEYSSLSEELRIERSRLMEDVVIQFPDRERFVLPTPFGNIVRAVEVYSRYTYGMDYSGCWIRMLTVIPADYRNLIEASKGQVDFWINIYFLSVCILFEIIAVWHFTGLNYLFVYIALIILLASTFMVRAQSAAQTWGTYVSSAFDVYKNKLREILDLQRPKSRVEERVMWTRFSQSIIYRIPESMPEINSQDSQPQEKKPSSTHRNRNKRVISK